MKYDLAMFDFDGTICDTGAGIVRSVQYALKKFGIDEPDQEKLRAFVGPPLRSSFSRFYGFSEDDALKATEYYRELYSVDGIYQSQLYPGVTAMLDRLRAAGVRCAVASGKPTHMVRLLLDHFDIADRFCFVSGHEGEREQKADIIRYLLESLGHDKAGAVMLGDRENDAFGAAGADVDFIACEWGYADPGEFDGYPQVFSARTPVDVTGFLIK